MKITQDLRAEVLAMAEVEKGIAEKSAEFLEKGGRLCEGVEVLPVDRTVDPEDADSGRSRPP